MLSEFPKMYSGRFGNISATKHRIELTLGASPIYRAPYRAGSTAPEKGKTEIDRMLEPATVKLLPKTKGPFCVRSVADATVVIDQDGVSN